MTANLTRCRKDRLGLKSNIHLQLWSTVGFFVHFPKRFAAITVTALKHGRSLKITRSHRDGVLGFQLANLKTRDMGCSEQVEHKMRGFLATDPISGKVNLAVSGLQRNS